MIRKVFFLIFISKTLFSSGLILRDFRGDLSLNRKSAMYKGMPFYNYDVIETKKGGRAKIFYKNVLTLYVGENSKLVIEELGNERLVLKFPKGLVRIEEKGFSNYEIKTPSAYVSGTKTRAQYFLASYLGRTDLIAVYGRAIICDYNIKYDGNIPDGFITPVNEVMVNAGEEISVRITDSGRVLFPKAGIKSEKKVVFSYEKAVQVALDSYELNPQTVYDFIWFDSPLPEGKQEHSMSSKSSVEKTKVLPRVFDPKEKHGLSIYTK